MIVPKSKVICETYKASLIVLLKAQRLLCPLICSYSIYSAVASICRPIATETNKPAITTHAYILQGI